MKKPKNYKTVGVGQEQINTNGFIKISSNGIYFSNTPFKSENDYKLPKRYIFNGKATILIWDDNSKTIIKKSSDDKDNRLIAFLTAYFQKNSGLSRNKANKYLDEIIAEEILENEGTKEN